MFKRVLASIMIIGMMSIQVAGEGVDLTDVGRGLFSRSYEWEKKSRTGYNTDALHGFTPKINMAIKKSPVVSEFLKEACGGCDFFLPTLEEDIIALAGKSALNETDYISVMAKHINPEIKISTTYALMADINGTMKSTLASIMSQVVKQMKDYREVSGIGLYTDGDLENSPFDLAEDVRRIDEIFLRELPKIGDFRNTTQQDAAGLITGNSSMGAMSSGENYTIDLASDIEKALMGDKTEGKNGVIGGDATTCEDGFCITVEFIKSTAYSTFARGVGEASLQALFEEGLDWLTKFGDKRNLSCKTAPTIGQFEARSTRSFKLSDIFTGPSFHLGWRVPRFLEGFLLNSKSGVTQKETQKDPKKVEERIDNSLKAAYRKRGMEYTEPTNMISSQREDFERKTLSYRGMSIPYENLQIALDRLDQVHSMHLKGSGSTLRHIEQTKINSDSIKSFEKIFDEISARTKLWLTYEQDLTKSLNEILSKDYCTN